MSEKLNVLEKANVRNVQSYIIFSGPLETINGYFFVLDRIMHSCNSPMQAVELCFKSFSSFKLEYSIASHHIWSFLHKYGFEIKGRKATVGVQKIYELARELEEL